MSVSTDPAGELPLVCHQSLSVLSYPHVLISTSSPYPLECLDSTHQHFITTKGAVIKVIKCHYTEGGKFSQTMYKSRVRR